MKLSKYIIIIQRNDKNIRTYFVLVIVRVLLVFIPQFGYIDPDEFLQSMKVIAVIPYFCVKIPLNFLNFITIYVLHYLQIDLRTSYALLAFPLLIMVLFSVNDWSLYKISKSYSVNYEIRMVALASSFVMLVFGSRTFSNTIEIGLYSLLLYIVADTMVHSNTVIFQTDFLQEKYDAAETTVEKVKLYKMISSLPHHSFNNCWLISTICVIGIFNRPTFLFFGMSIVFFWLFRGMGTKTISFMDFNLRITALILCGIPSLIFVIVMDSLYFGYLPLLYNILGVVSIVTFASMIYRFCIADFKNLPRAQSISALMTTATFIPLGLLSLVNHQEPRFLLPLTLPIIFLHGTKLQTGLRGPELMKCHKIVDYISSKLSFKSIVGSTVIRYWYIINIIFTFFFGFIHQGGVFQMAKEISKFVLVPDSVTHVHLVTSHIYNVPLSFFFLPSTETMHINKETGQKYRRNKRFFMYEYGGMNVYELYRKLKIILDYNEMKLSTKGQKYQLYLTMPTSLTEDLSLAFWRSNSTVMKHEPERVKVFYPHLSTEALPKFSIKHPAEIKTDVFDLDQKCSLYERESDNDSLVFMVFKEFSSIVHQFGLALYQIEVGRKENL